MIGNSVTFIGSSAFFNCTALTSISIPICTNIQGNAFAQCTNLTTVYLNNVSEVTTLGYGAFSYCDALTSIYVPSSLYTMFQSNYNWQTYSSFLVSI